MVFVHINISEAPEATVIFNAISHFLIDAKAAEAAQSAYYDPNRPQCAYVPPPAYYVSSCKVNKSRSKRIGIESKFGVGEMVISNLFQESPPSFQQATEKKDQ